MAPQGRGGQISAALALRDGPLRLIFAPAKLKISGFDMTGKSTVPGRGRKPKPAARKLLAGNPGKRAINKNEPQFTPITHADPPEWFDDTARQMWETVIHELCAQRVLYVTDLHNVVLFCSAFRNWHESQMEVMRSGITIETETGPKKTRH